MILGDGAFRLYLYMMANKDGYTFALSQANVEERIGLKEGRYRNAVKELQEKYYLKPEREHTNRYTIYEYPNATLDEIYRRSQAKGAETELLAGQELTGQSSEIQGPNHVKNDTEIKLNIINRDNDTMAGNTINNNTIPDKIKYDISGRFGADSRLRSCGSEDAGEAVREDRMYAFEDLDDDDGELPF